MRAKAWQLIAYAVFGMVFAGLLLEHGLLKGRIFAKYWMNRYVVKYIRQLSDRNYRF